MGWVIVGVFFGVGTTLVFGGLAMLWAFGSYRIGN